METGTTETGCVFHEPGGGTCHKLIETGTRMCPYHNLVTEHREQEKAKRESEARKRGRSGAKRV